MSEALLQLTLFAGKVFILFLFIFLILLAFFSLLAKSKEKIKGRLVVKHLNKKYEDLAEIILGETLTKKAFKKIIKDKKATQKEKLKAADKKEEKKKNIYVLNFNGDIRASAVTNLIEEINAILSIATPKDEVVVRLESAGGMLHGYGLATAELLRIRAKKIPLTIAIDKIAASGGYMMACVANKIFAAPFAIIGSIGVIVQLPNFHRLLKKNNIDYEQHTAGEFKRTITLFGENTSEGRKKLQEEIEDVHQIFKNLIVEHRKHIDIQKVATGEHWVGLQALSLNLIDEVKTSDDYLLTCTEENANVYEISYETRKPFLSKFSAAAKLWSTNLLKVFG